MDLNLILTFESILLIWGHTNLFFEKSNFLYSLVFLLKKFLSTNSLWDSLKTDLPRINEYSPFEFINLLWSVRSSSPLRFRINLNSFNFCTTKKYYRWPTYVNMSTKNRVMEYKILQINRIKTYFKFNKRRITTLVFFIKKTFFR